MRKWVKACESWKLPTELPGLIPPNEAVKLKLDITATIQNTMPTSNCPTNFTTHKISNY